MDLSKVSEILESGGRLEYKGKYYLQFEEKWNINPEKEWAGFTICKLDLWNYEELYSTMRLSEALEKFQQYIDDESRKEEYDNS